MRGELQEATWQAFWRSAIREEEPNVLGAFALAFDTYSPFTDDREEGVESPEAPLSNHISIHWDGRRAAAHQFNRFELRLVTGMFHAVRLAVTEVAGDSSVSVTIRTAQGSGQGPR